jgi:hypothetical protein
MTLNDEITDFARDLASERILNDPTDAEIVDAVSEYIGINLAHNSIGARLALASYNRYDVLRKIPA